MTAVICIVLISWFVSALIRSSEAKKQAKRMAKIKAEQTRQKEELRQQREDAKEWARQQVEMQREQIRLAKEQERQARELEKHEAVLRKHEEQINKLTYNAQQAQEDIDNLAYRIEELQKYEKYLELERDACVPGGKEYFKWQNKVAQIDDKIYRMTKQMNKAKFVLVESKRKMEEVA